MPAPLTGTPAPPGGSSRLAGIAPPTARRLLAGLAAVLLLAGWAASRPPPPAEGQSAATIHIGLARALASGGDYYLAAVEALRAADRPADPFTVRLPTLGTIATILPQLVLTALLWLLALGTAAVWYRRLAPAVPPVAMALLLLGGMLAVLQPGAALVQENWAGLLIALSLAVARPGRLVEAAALGLAAALIVQGAAFYPLAMATVALLAKRRREALGWSGAIALFALVFLVHARAVLGAGGHGWEIGGEPAGPLAVLRAIADATLLRWLPAWLGASLVLLAAIGWAVSRGRAAWRVGVILLILLLFGATRSRDDAGEAALLVAPLSLVGFAFAVPALRRLAVAALDRRRITVTRIAR